MGNENEEVVYLYLDDIIPNRFQPREIFEDRSLKELAISIKEHGVIQPIIVRRIGSKFEIIAGERRYKASTLAGLTKIPAIIKDLDDKESSKVALIENLQRRDLTPIEEARTYQKILDIDDLTQEELARTMGKSQSAISNKLRLLSLPEEVQDALLHEEISERHARSLLNVSGPARQIELLRKVISARMTVRELDNEIKKINPLPMTANKPKPIKEPQLVPTEQIIEKKNDNLEFLGGIDTIVSPIDSKKETNEESILQNTIKDNFNPSKLITETDNIVNNPKEELIGGGLLPGMKQSTDEPIITKEELISPSLPDNINNDNMDVIEVLDIDSSEPKPQIIPVKPQVDKAIYSIRKLGAELKSKGYKIDINELNNQDSIEIVFRINKD